jgi:hypothetical protein
VRASRRFGNTELESFTIGKAKAGITLQSKGREEKEEKEYKTTNM